MTQCIFFRDFFCCTKVTCQLKCSTTEVKKTPTRFDASMHLLQGFLLLYGSYMTVKMQYN